MWVITSNCDKKDTLGYFEVVFDKKPSLSQLGRFMYNMSIKDMTDKQLTDVVALSKGKCNEEVYYLTECESGVQKSVTL